MENNTINTLKEEYTKAISDAIDLAYLTGFAEGISEAIENPIGAKFKLASKVTHMLMEKAGREHFADLMNEMLQNGGKTDDEE